MTEGNAPETYSRRNGKSAAAFRTISEVASELDVPSHVLRFWETKFSQVRPLKRGGGRRYYRPEDISLLRKIRGLLYDDGYTIKGVQKLLREGGAKSDILKDAAAADRSANSRDGVLTRAQRSALEEIMGELKALRELADKS
jgi:DNA-binding transcriptional MerR regulator